METRHTSTVKKQRDGKEDRRGAVSIDFTQVDKIAPNDEGGHSVILYGALQLPRMKVVTFSSRFTLPTRLAIVTSNECCI